MKIVISPAMASFTITSYKFETINHENNCLFFRTAQLTNSFSINYFAIIVTNAHQLITLHKSYKTLLGQHLQISSCASIERKCTLLEESYLSPRFWCLSRASIDCLASKCRRVRMKNKIQHDSMVSFRVSGTINFQLMEHWLSIVTLDSTLHWK